MGKCQKMDNQLSALIDVKTITKRLNEFQCALAVAETPHQVKRILVGLDFLTEYVRRFKLGILVEMDVVETAVWAEYELGIMLKRAKENGDLHEGGRPPQKPVCNEHRFTLKQAGIDNRHESEHAQRYVDYVERFDLDSLRDLVREQKLARTLSRSGVYKTIDQALRRQEHVERSNDEPIGTLQGLYEIILADPPWQYDAASTESRAIENQYLTASLEEIKLHIPEAAEDSVLFLWATAPKLLEALEVLDAWGFCYRTHAIWDKEIMGMGHWFRGQHELLLVGIRGEFSPPQEFLRVSSVFRERRSTHSTKPQVVYEWIEKTWPQERKLEMYARRPRKGWANWGKP
jgi:N6-adenosine-specific RNA methylase IME4